MTTNHASSSDLPNRQASERAPRIQGRRACYRPALAALLIWAGAAVGVPSLTAQPEASDSWRAGVASVKITPAGPLWMGGFAPDRPKPSEGVYQDIFAKALALSDPAGGRIVIVTADLLGISDPLVTSPLPVVPGAAGQTGSPPAISHP